MKAAATSSMRTNADAKVAVAYRADPRSGDCRALPIPVRALSGCPWLLVDAVPGQRDLAERHGSEAPVRFLARCSAQRTLDHGPVPSATLASNP